MPSWPFTKLHIGSQYTVAISGPFIHLIDSKGGQILHTVKSDDGVVVTCSAVDKNFGSLTTIGDDKRLRVWNIGNLQLVLESTRELPKKATQVSFFEDETSQSIVVADKFGDVYKYPLVPRLVTRTTTTSGRESLASHENPHGDLILGHASIITCFTFSADERFIITADRDEHIRASRFPRGYIIERYCLGHKHFISAIKIPPFDPTILLSGGGDPYLSVWDWKAGKEKRQIPILAAVKSYLQGTSTRVKWQKKNADGQRTAWRRRSKREQELEEELEVERSIDEQQEPSGSSKDVEANDKDESLDESGLVVKKIETFAMGGNQFIIFSVVGGSALCYCRYTENPEDTPDVRQLDLHKPILEFVFTPDDRILVTVDSNWTLPNVSEEVKPAIMVEWGDNRLQLSDKPSPLVETLNGQALQEASAHEIAAMGLYDDLVWLPKHPDGPEEDETFSRPLTPTPTSASSIPTGKMAARLKKKSHFRSVDTSQGGGIGSGTENGRGTKKTKLVEKDQD